MCFMHQFLGHRMPSRTTQESYRLRVSDRTMVADFATVTLVRFKKPMAPTRPK
jgi:hypothetical protein